jgi:hypothetical protein
MGKNQAVQQGNAMQDRLRRYWKKGYVAILARINEGPWRSKDIIVGCPRETFEEMIREEMAKPMEPEAGTVLQELSRDFLLRAERLSGEEATELQSVILVLTAQGLIAKGMGNLDGSAIDRLVVAIDPDESKPWTERGMINPSLHRLLNSDPDSGSATIH